MNLFFMNQLFQILNFFKEENYLSIIQVLNFDQNFHSKFYLLDHEIKYY